MQTDELPQILRITCFVVLLAITFAPVAQATDCKCEKHKAGATASGTCTRTEDRSYCQLTFNNGSNNQRASERMVSNLRLRDLRFVAGPSRFDDQISQAFGFFNRDRKTVITELRRLASKDPERVISSAFLTVVAAGWRRFPKELKELRQVIEKMSLPNTTKLVRAMIEKGKPLNVDLPYGYRGAAMAGCLAFRKKDFSAALRTHWAPEGGKC